MKTSVVMKRTMGDFTVEQRTKYGYFDANHLLKQWNEKHPKKEIKKFIELDKTKSFIDEIKIQETPIEESRLGDFQVITTIKGKNTKKGRTYDKVYMHPYLYLDFAMWLSSEFKYHVIKFVYDELIEYRHAIGLGNNYLMDAISQNWKINFQETFKRINYALNMIIFNESYRGIRNKATIDQLKDMRDIQKIYAYNINTGIIPDTKRLRLELRKEYVRRHIPNHKILEE